MSEDFRDMSKEFGNKLDFDGLGIRPEWGKKPLEAGIFGGGGGPKFESVFRDLEDKNDKKRQEAERQRSELGARVAQIKDEKGQSIVELAQSTLSTDFQSDGAEVFDNLKQRASQFEIRARELFPDYKKARNMHKDKGRERDGIAARVFEEEARFLRDQQNKVSGSKAPDRAVAWYPRSDRYYLDPDLVDSDWDDNPSDKFVFDVPVSSPHTPPFTVDIDNPKTPSLSIETVLPFDDDWRSGVASGSLGQYRGVDSQIAERTARAVESMAETQKPAEYISPPEDERNEAQWVGLVVSKINTVEIAGETGNVDPEDPSVAKRWEAIRALVDRMPNDLGKDLSEIDSELAEYMRGVGVDRIRTKELLNQYLASRKRLATRYAQVQFGSGTLTAYGVNISQTEQIKEIAPKLQDLLPHDFYLITRGHKLFEGSMAGVGNILEVKQKNGGSERVETKEVIGRVSEGSAVWSNVGYGHKVLDEDGREVRFTSYKAVLNDESELRRLQGQIRDHVGSASVERMARYMAWAKCTNLLWDRDQTALMAKGGEIKKIMSPEAPNIKAYIARGGEKLVPVNLGRIQVEPKGKLEKYAKDAIESGADREGVLERLGQMVKNQEHAIFLSESRNPGTFLGDFDNSTTVSVVDVPKFKHNLAAAIALGKLKPEDAMRDPRDPALIGGNKLEREDIFTQRTLASFYLDGNMYARAIGFENIPYLRVNPRNYTTYFTGNITTQQTILNEITKPVNYATERGLRESVLKTPYWSALFEGTFRFNHFNSPLLNQPEMFSRAVLLQESLKKKFVRNLDNPSPQDKDTLREIYSIVGYTSEDDVVNLSEPLRVAAVNIMNDPRVLEYLEYAHELMEQNISILDEQIRAAAIKKYAWSGSVAAESIIKWQEGSQLTLSDVTEMMRAIQNSNFKLTDEVFKQLESEVYSYGYRKPIFSGRR